MSDSYLKPITSWSYLTNPKTPKVTSFKLLLKVLILNKTVGSTKMALD